MKASNLERPDFLNQLKNANERLKAEVANELSDLPDAGDRSNIGDNMIKSQLNRAGISIQVVSWLIQNQCLSPRK